MTCVALLRGINVGGRHTVPMAALAEVFGKAGCTDVRTYIQSGNVVFNSAVAPGRLQGVLEKAIRTKFGFAVPVVTRTATELARVARSNPYLKRGADPDVLHVAFLAGKPDAKGAVALDPRRSPPDRFEVRGRDIYLNCPNGMARTKLTNAWFDATLKTTSTMRNWRTVLALLAMAQGKPVEPGAR